MLTNEQKLEIALELGRFSRGDKFVRVARREDGSVYASPAEPRSDYADETIKYFDFSHMSASEGDRAVWDWLVNVI